MRGTRKIIRFVIGLGLIASMSGNTGRAQERDASLYVATKSCKMCHKKEEAGAQFAKWEERAHRKAYETLAGAESKAVAAKLGIDDPQTSGKCLKCHSTAYNMTEERQVEVINVEHGVTCQSCHGPGKNYKKKEIMKDRAAAVEAGLVFPATDHCTVCHNDSSPTWDPERYTRADGTKTGFDVDLAFEKIKHPVPEK